MPLRVRAHGAGLPGAGRRPATRRSRSSTGTARTPDSSGRWRGSGFSTNRAYLPRPRRDVRPGLHIPVPGFGAVRGYADAAQISFPGRFEGRLQRLAERPCGLDAVVRVQGDHQGSRVRPLNLGGGPDEGRPRAARPRFDERIDARGLEARAHESGQAFGGEHADAGGSDERHRPVERVVDERGPGRRGGGVASGGPWSRRARTGGRPRPRGSCSTPRSAPTESPSPPPNRRFAHAGAVAAGSRPRCGQATGAGGAAPRTRSGSPAPSRRVFFLPESSVGDSFRAMLPRHGIRPSKRLGVLILALAATACDDPFDAFLGDVPLTPTEVTLHDYLTGRLEDPPAFDLVSAIPARVEADAELGLPLPGASRRAGARPLLGGRRQRHGLRAADNGRTLRSRARGAGERVHAERPAGGAAGRCSHRPQPRRPEQLSRLQAATGNCRSSTSTPTREPSPFTTW